MIFQIGYITIDGKDYPVFMSADGYYRLNDKLELEKIYVSRSEIHQ